MPNNVNAFIYSDDFLDYAFHPQHPFNQKRLVLTKDLLELMQSLGKGEIIAPKPITDDILASIHTKEYLTAVKKAIPDIKNFGIGSIDTPVFSNMYHASKAISAGTIHACDLVASGKKKRAINLGGGLHHSFPGYAAGFCIFNDLAVAIKQIRKNYPYKILYIDTDAHHGDGVQHCFYDDPNVCTVSFHETGRYLYPGTGKVDERGKKAGYGYSFNFPLDAYTEDESFLEVFTESLTLIAEYFEPDIIISQHGVDAHILDPLTHLHSTMKIYEQIPVLIKKLADHYCDGKWVATGGGGYNIWKVVPRAWSQLWKVMKDGQPFQGPLPETWLKKWEKQTNDALPKRWDDKEENFPSIPRREEIRTNNRSMTQQSLSFLYNLL
ncbi:acetoin utilization protein AcuC [Gracilibacillus sp. YIM 98692]|uniref:acetoin utilization protein AcuC n=1 Tax=Gracilibacillus sp. YIM 98692 TaxID=2663532 RepID=UPI0013D352A4|nr:acetoin utilization protein AcuC [Gracilibacillus sp. YIM 98692]